MKNSFRIAEISFGRSHWDAAFEFEYGDARFEVQRFGANFSVDNVKALIYRLRNDVDAFALSSLPPVVKLDSKSYVHRQYLDIMNTPSSVPLCDGTGLREISNINSLIRLIEEKKIEPDLGVFFPAALLSVEVEEFIRHRYPKSVYFGDAYSMFGLPFMVQPFPGLMTLSKIAMNVVNFQDLRKNTPLAENRLQKMSRSSLASQVENVQYVAGDMPFLLLFDRAVEFIRGKDLIIWSHHSAQEEELRKYGPRSVVNLFPEEYKFCSHMSYSILDAVLRLTNKKTAPLSIEEWEQLLSMKSEIRPVVRKYVLARNTSTQAKITQGIEFVRRKMRKDAPPDFAFIIHALSHGDFERLPGLGSALKLLPKKMHNNFDRQISKAPGIVYGTVNHVISDETGREINGIVYGLFSTPKVLRETPPEVTYAKIERICYDAAARGAKIIGLGAYTKVIGDSGITINQNSPIPVTTGNSLSASATLWGLYDVVEKMRLLERDRISGHVDGMAMVIGATGSIGSVSAKLLALAFKRLCLVAPRLNRLEELAAEIRLMAPHCEITLCTDANELAEQADVLVTATSAFDQKIIDVMRLKPGCIVCDCSRPLDFSIEDAKKRPDVLIIESGEVVLPGPYELNCDLALPGKTVYACLAETALLALEEKYEPFTLGRDIDWLKVKEIYKLARRHGVKLSAIQGHMGFISDREIELTRELALARRKK
jgi:predicted amino acid dehydrogenase